MLLPEQKTIFEIPSQTAVLETINISEFKIINLLQRNENIRLLTDNELSILYNYLIKYGLNDINISQSMWNINKEKLIRYRFWRINIYINY